MMDQKSGKFLMVDDLDLTPSTAESTPTPSRAVAQWNLPLLAENEAVDVKLATPWGEERGTINIMVEKIKPNGKLFAYTTYGRDPHLPDQLINVGDLAIVKGVKFSIRRFNDRGVLGLKMLNATEVALLPTLKPQEPLLPGVSASLHPASFEPAPSKVHPLFPPSGPTESQIKRRERKARARAARAELREQNFLLAKMDKTKELTKSQRRERGAQIAAERKRKKKLAPMLAAQEQARLRLEKEKGRRVVEAPSAVVSVVVAGVA